jgi:hypothetical protein
MEVERNQQISRLSTSIKRNAVSDADFIALALENSAKKKAKQSHDVRISFRLAFSESNSV